MWKFVVTALIVLSVFTMGFVVIKTNRSLTEAGMEKIELSPFIKKADEAGGKIEEDTQPSNIDAKSLDLMLFGIDRRSREEFGYRTDIMVLVSIDLTTKQTTLTSLPRDLWWDGGRLNAVFLGSGWESMQNAVETITGRRPEKYILTDFKDFSWIVDAMGGVPVEVETTFSDSEYPIDETFEYQTVTFNQGAELLTGERALIFSRSRKGTNGEGSDWMRMRRQHKILKGMLTAVLSPKSIFNPMVIENAFKTVTTAKMDTNLSLEDAKYIWDLYKNRELYNISSLFLDSAYLHSPPMEEYGGAWVLVPTTGSYTEFQNVLSATLKGQVLETPITETAPQE